MSKQSYKFRLYPTSKQAQVLTWTLGRCRELYNAALQERRDAYRMADKSITYYDQANQLPEIKEIREEYKDIHLVSLGLWPAPTRQWSRRDHSRFRSSQSIAGQSAPLERRL